jgi:ribosomal protein S4
MIEKQNRKKEDIQKLWKKRFMEKQAWKAWFGGWTEKKNRRFFLEEKDYKETWKKRGRTLQNILVETGWARSPMQARMWVKEGKISVNGEKIKNPHYLIRVGDWFEGHPSLQKELKGRRPYWWNKLIKGITAPELEILPQTSPLLFLNPTSFIPSENSNEKSEEKKELEECIQEKDRDYKGVGLDLLKNYEEKLDEVRETKNKKGWKKKGLVTYKDLRMYPGVYEVEQYAVEYTGYGWLDRRAGRFLLSSLPEPQHHLSPFQTTGFQESFQLAKQFYRKQRL